MRSTKHGQFDAFDFCGVSPKGKGDNQYQNQASLESQKRARGKVGQARKFQHRGEASGRGIEEGDRRKTPQQQKGTFSNCPLQGKRAILCRDRKGVKHQRFFDREGQAIPKGDRQNFVR